MAYLLVTFFTFGVGVGLLAYGNTVSIIAGVSVMAIGIGIFLIAFVEGGEYFRRNAGYFGLKKSGVEAILEEIASINEKYSSGGEMIPDDSKRLRCLQMSLVERKAELGEYRAILECCSASTNLYVFFNGRGVRDILNG